MFAFTASGRGGYTLFICASYRDRNARNRVIANRARKKSAWIGRVWPRIFQNCGATDIEQLPRLLGAKARERLCRSETWQAWTSAILSVPESRDNLPRRSDS